MQNCKLRILMVLPLFRVLNPFHAWQRAPTNTVFWLPAVRFRVDRGHYGACGRRLKNRDNHVGPEVTDDRFARDDREPAGSRTALQWSCQRDPLAFRSAVKPSSAVFSLMAERKVNPSLFPPPFRCGESVRSEYTRKNTPGGSVASPLVRVKRSGHDPVTSQ